MEKAAKLYKARFVINISELGEDDPLAQNVRPWQISLARNFTTICFMNFLVVPSCLRSIIMEVLVVLV